MYYPYRIHKSYYRAHPKDNRQQSWHSPERADGRRKSPAGSNNAFHFASDTGFKRFTAVKSAVKLVAAVRGVIPDLALFARIKRTPPPH